MLESLATVSIWKLLVVGVFGLIALVLAAVFVLGIAAILGPGMRAVSGGWSRPTDKSRRMRPSTRILGVGIVSLATGLGIVLAFALYRAIGWEMVGVVLLSFGLGLVVFYGIASRAEKPVEGGGSEPAPTEQTAKE
jgi:hypothetical protein